MSIDNIKRRSPILKDFKDDYELYIDIMEETLHTKHTSNIARYLY